MNIQFQYPEALWLLTLVPFFILLFVIYKLWRRKAVKRIGDPLLVKELYKGYAPSKATLKFIFFVLAFIGGCLALANPRRPEEGVGENRKGIDILVALDVSNSMLATDVPPTRLQQAKDCILKLTAQYPDDRIGLVLFAGTAYLQMPLTFDHNSAQLFVSTATPAAITAQGTAIGDALEKGSLAFDKQSDRFKTIVLVTDGETHDEGALEKAKELAGKGIMINTIGLGSAQGATITDSVTKAQKKDASGNVVISKLNEDLLKQLAVTTNGTYIHFDNTQQVIKGLQQQLSQVARKSLPDVSQLNFETFYMWLALPMLLLLILELFFPERKQVKA